MRDSNFRGQKKASKPKLKGKISLVIFSLAFLGLIISVTIIRIHYQISGNPETKSLCHFSDLFNCDAVLASSYGKVGPVFHAELSLAYYFSFILGMLSVLGSKKSLPTLSFLFICSAFAFVYSAGLNFISISQIGAICLLCMTLSLINLAILVLLPMEMKTRFRELPLIIKKNLVSEPKKLFYLAISAILLFGMSTFYARRLNPRARFSFEISPEPYLKSFYGLPKNEAVLPERPTFGNQNARVTIVAFSDLQCKTCREAESILRPILEKYQDRIRLVYLNYPPNAECNPMAGRTKHHMMACISAKEALCSYQMGKFQEYRDWAFRNQAGYKSPSTLAKEIKIDPQIFEKCLDSEETLSLLSQDIATAVKFNNQGLPSFYINGRRFRDWPSAEGFGWILEAELSKTERR